MHVLCQSNYQVRIPTQVTDKRTEKLLNLAKFTSWQKDRLVLADGVLERCDIGMKIAFIKKHVSMLYEEILHKKGIKLFIFRKLINLNKIGLCYTSSICQFNQVSGEK